MNRVGQGDMKLDIKGFKKRKQSRNVVMRDLGEMEILICINTLIKILLVHHSNVIRQPRKLTTGKRSEKRGIFE